MGNSTDREMKRKAEESAEAEGSKEKKLPYPKAILFILGNEFCERFSYFGMQGILSLYLKQKLHFSEDTATTVYHTFVYFCYFCPILGGILSDSWLGKFKTIVYLSIIYVLGHLLKTLAAVPNIGIPPVEISLLGLAFIALGTGGIKPCVGTLGADQFKLPEQQKQLDTYFYVFFFVINLGSVLSTIITPNLRQEVKCFGDDTCYSLAFGIPAILMFVATVILIVGKRWYVMKEPQGNMLINVVVGSIWYALRKNNFWIFGNRKSDNNNEHWMDKSMEAYPKILVEDVKLLLKVLFLFIPCSVFFALFLQMGSRWTFQATRMNGDLGFVTIKPDQMHIFNPLLLLILIPIFDRLLYPFLDKYHTASKKMLHRMILGGCLIACSFIISGILELQVLPARDHIPKEHQSHLHLMNTLNCPVHVEVTGIEGGGNFSEKIEGHSNVILYQLAPQLYEVKVTVNKTCQAVTDYEQGVVFNATEKKVSGMIVRSNANNSLQIYTLLGFEKPKKLENTPNNIRVIFDDAGLSEKSLQLRPNGKEEGAITFTPTLDNNELSETNYTKVPPSHYEIYLDNEIVGKKEIGQGGVRTMYVTKHNNNNNNSNNNSNNNNNNSNVEVLDFILTHENEVHMLWQFPQFFVLTLAELFYMVPGAQFAYSQAPESMKSVIFAVWLLQFAFGNLIIIAVAESKAFGDHNRASEFFMFAGVMFADMILFSVMAYFYEYTDIHKVEKERKERGEQYENNKTNNDNKKKEEEERGMDVRNRKPEDSYSTTTNETNLG